MILKLLLNTGENNENYNSNNESKILTVFDDIIADMLRNIKL